MRHTQHILCNMPTACMGFVFQIYKMYFRHLWLLSRNTISVLSVPAIASNQSFRLLCYNTKKHFTQERSAVKHRMSERSQVFFSVLFCLYILASGHEPDLWVLQGPPTSATAATYLILQFAEEECYQVPPMLVPEF